jgi:hypothetical protein
MPSPLFLSSYVIRFGILASDYVLTLFSSRLGWFLERFHSNFFFSILVSVVFFGGGFFLVVSWEMEMKKANMGMSTVITSLNIIFQHDALQNVTRAGQLVGHNLRIQLQEMLHGQDSKLSQHSDEIKAATEGHVMFLHPEVLLN